MQTVDDLYFVEEGQPRGFCSEACIEKFYAPLIEGLEKIEVDLRTQYKLKAEDCLEFVGRPKDMEAVIRKPMEVWRSENILKEEVYSFITQLRDNSNQPYWVILLCSVFDHRPSFILLATTTRDKRLKEHFEIGKQVEDIEVFHESLERPERQDLDVAPEILESLERKKASYLADLLDRHSPHDIPFEDYMMYEKYFESTMAAPDEIYQFKDEEGDLIYTYIKAHAEGAVSFFYFVLCMPVGESADDSDAQAVVPVIAFPTLDADIHRAYKQGTLISGALKN